jgi:hypothetical protein
MMNKRNSIRVAMEAILLLLYAWNSSPIPGTDLSRCFVALGREFQFPIDFSANKHFELTSTPSTIASYLRDLATHLSALREVAGLSVKEQRAFHREFVNSWRPDPMIYSVGILCLPVAPFVPTWHADKWTNSHTLSQVHGELCPNYMARHMSLNTAPLKPGTRNTPSIYPLILPN